MPQDAPEPVVIHTDGSCLSNPGPGGWAAILQWQGNERELTGSEPDTTNNRMELMAAIMGLNAVTRPMLEWCAGLDAPLEGQWLENRRQKASCQSRFMATA